MKIKTINRASLICGLTAGGFVLLMGLSSAFALQVTLLAGMAAFLLVALVTQLVIRKFIVYRIKPLYQIVLSRDVKINELESQLIYRQDMVGHIGSELSTWAENNSREIARLKENEQYRREFLGNISHEMKTPIFTIQGYISTLLDGAADDPAVNRKYLARAEKSIDRMIEIVTDLEQISKLESGTLILEQERFDVAALAREIAEDASLEAERNDITILIEGQPFSDPVDPVPVVADRKYIERVLWNLVINSIKYGRRGGRTDISFADLFDKVMVEVSDDGIGIAASEIPRVFERFYRSDKSRSREMGGTGLGLSIVKHIIEAHNEQISVRSQPGAGSTFSFTLSKPAGN